MLKHTELARRGAVALAASPTLQPSKEGIALLKSFQDTLRTGLVEPLMHRFPELRDIDAAQAKVVPVATLGAIDKATAERIDRVITIIELQSKAFRASISTVRSTTKDFEAWQDLLTEPHFITAPIDRHFPELFEARLAKIKPERDPRSEKNDAAMREQAVPLREITLTPAARSAIACYERGLKPKGA